MKRKDKDHSGKTDENPIWTGTSLQQNSIKRESIQKVTIQNSGESENNSFTLRSEDLRKALHLLNYGETELDSQNGGRYIALGALYFYLKLTVDNLGRLADYYTPRTVKINLKKSLHPEATRVRIARLMLDQIFKEIYKAKFPYDDKFLIKFLKNEKTKKKENGFYEYFKSMDEQVKSMDNTKLSLSSFPCWSYPKIGEIIFNELNGFPLDYSTVARADEYK